jgi:hypothetical protein
MYKSMYVCRKVCIFPHRYEFFTHVCIKVCTYAENYVFFRRDMSLLRVCVVCSYVCRKVCIFLYRCYYVTCVCMMFLCDISLCLHVYCVLEFCTILCVHAFTFPCTHACMYICGYTRVDSCSCNCEQIGAGKYVMRNKKISTTRVVVCVHASSVRVCAHMYSHM